jgi:hypothetical protein
MVLDECQCCTEKVSKTNFTAKSIPVIELHLQPELEDGLSNILIKKK